MYISTRKRGNLYNKSFEFVDQQVIFTISTTLEDKVLLLPKPEGGGFQGNTQRLSPESQNIIGRVFVSIHHETTGWTGMHSNNQRFLNHRSTARTLLRFVAWINEYKLLLKSFLSFMCSIIWQYTI
jgi:hypothetical protein